ncbi:MAG: GIY-YIG nuclease family protein [Christensenellaceae bacterium]|nr:GIY-YIG nuclease family protein [Christensenellaceae bacterium]
MLEIIVDVVLIVLAAAVAVAVFVGLWWIYKRGNTPTPTPQVEITPDPDKQKIDALLQYIENQKREAEERERIKNLKKSEQKEKLEKFKQTRDSLKDNLMAKLDQKEWTPLAKILRSADKGGVGIYILHNETKNKYYVGQAKALTARIKKHFEVEQIAQDFLSGDKISVKVLTATELGDDYRIDHLEKLGIEIYDADKNGYNKTAGNL